MSDSMGGNGGMAPPGRRERGLGQDRTLAPVSHTAPALAAAVRKAAEMRASTIEVVTAPVSEKSNKMLSMPLSREIHDTVTSSIILKGRQDAAGRKAAASQRLLQDARDAAADQKLRTEAYNDAVEEYFYKNSHTPGGKTLDRLARNNAMTVIQAAEVVARGDAASLGASPSEEKELAAHVQGAQKNPKVREAQKAMLAGGAVLAMAARGAASEHEAYANDATFGQESVSNLQLFGDDISKIMRQEISGVDPINLGGPPASSSSILDTMEKGMQSTMETALERFGEIASAPLKLAR